MEELEHRSITVGEMLDALEGYDRDSELLFLPGEDIIDENDEEIELHPAIAVYEDEEIHYIGDLCVVVSLDDDDVQHLMKTQEVDPQLN